MVYRDPSPGAADQGTPLVVLAPQRAFWYRLRLPLAQANALRRLEEVTLELLPVRSENDNHPESLPQHLVRRFPARPVHFRALEHEPTIAVIDMVCTPPKEAIRDLALSETVRAQLIWLPPVYTLPLFVLSAIPAMIGGGGLLVTRRRQPAVIEPNALANQPKPANAHINQADPDAIAVRLLGEQLGEMIGDGHIDPSLLATIEWILDRHGLQGAQLLAQGLEGQGSVGAHLERLVDRGGTNGSSGGDPQRSEILLKRLLRLLDAIAPDQATYSTEPTAPRITK